MYWKSRIFFIFQVDLSGPDTAERSFGGAERLVSFCFSQLWTIADLQKASEGGEGGGYELNVAAT